MRTLNRALLSTLAVLAAAPLAAQTNQLAVNTAPPADTPAVETDSTPKKATSIRITIAHQPWPSGPVRYTGRR